MWTGLCVFIDLSSVVCCGVVDCQCDYFRQPFVNTLQFLDELALKDKDEKLSFFQSLSAVIGTFPSMACKYKVHMHGSTVK